MPVSKLNSQPTLNSAVAASCPPPRAGNLSSRPHGQNGNKYTPFPRRFQAGIAVWGISVSSWRAARKERHWKAGGQDTQDTQDTQESTVREWTIASHLSIASE